MRRFLRMWRAAFGKFTELVNPAPIGDAIAGPVVCGRCGAKQVYQYAPVLEDNPTEGRDFYHPIRCLRCKESRMLIVDSFMGLEAEAKLFGDKLDPYSPAFVGKRLGPKALFKLLRGGGGDGA